MQQVPGTRRQFSCHAYYRFTHASLPKPPRHCPQLSALLLSFGAFQHKVIAPPLLAALPAALPRTITRLTLDAGGYGGQLLLSPLGQLTTLTQLRLGAPTAPGSAAWLPPSLQRLGLWAGCGPAWLDAVGPCCGDSLQALHLQMLSPPDWGNDLGERLTAALQQVRVLHCMPDRQLEQFRQQPRTPLRTCDKVGSALSLGLYTAPTTPPQLTRITSVTGTTEAPPSGDSLKLALEGIPVTLRRLLLYCQVEDTVSFPCAFTKQPGQDDDVVPGLEEFAAAPYWTAEQPFPVMRNLRVLHVTLLFVMPMPDNFADHFPSLTRIVCGDICGDEAVLPAISSLTALPNLVSCSFVTGAPYHTHAFSLAEFSQLTALRDLELRSLGMSFQRFENGGGSTLPRPFAEFQGAVRAPQLTRLVLRCMIDRDEDCGEAETDAAGWPRGPDAFAAALRAASPAGERLQVVFDDEEDWQPCLLQPGDGN